MQAIILPCFFSKICKINYTVTLSLKTLCDSIALPYPPKGVMYPSTLGRLHWRLSTLSHKLPRWTFSGSSLPWHPYFSFLPIQIQLHPERVDESIPSLWNILYYLQTARTISSLFPPELQIFVLYWVPTTQSEHSLQKSKVIYFQVQGNIRSSLLLPASLENLILKNPRTLNNFARNSSPGPFCNYFGNPDVATVSQCPET